MKVILCKDLEGVGSKGQVLEVSDGYARNYLVPRGLAVIANESSLKAVEVQRQKAVRQAEREKADAIAQANLLNGSTVVIRAKAGESGKLFGAVTAKDLADAVNDQLKLHLDKRKFQLQEPIKTLGAYTVTLKLHTGVTAKLVVNVVPE